MLYVALMKPRASSVVERVTKRMQYEYPEGCRMVAEYWLHTADVRVVSVFEVDESHGTDVWMKFAMAWEDEFEITVSPAMTSEQGISWARQAMST